MVDKDTAYRALVVDDEEAVRKLLMKALSKQGFECDSASNGEEAEDRCSRFHYDAVVTDLRMPKMHGYALAMHLLSQKRKPITVVHTGLMEPRLANDLLSRGVDDIIFKPYDFGVLATKVKELVKRRFTIGERPSAILGSMPERISQPEADPEATAISLADLRDKQVNAAKLLPRSPAAIDVYRMSCGEHTKTSELAAAIQRDAAFTAEILRHANNPLYNPSRQPVTQLENAVVRIGRKRIGELALGMSALRTITTILPPWMDIDLAWRQSMAAGLAIDLLVKQGKHQSIDDGLMLGAIMHPLGRILLASLYPGNYERLIERCSSTGESLLHLERVVFPLSQYQVLTNILSTWGIPKEVLSPLLHLQDDYSNLAKAREPVRTKAELVKLAILVGRIAINCWQPWDEVDLPPGYLLRRLGINDIAGIIEQTREDVGFLSASNVDQLKEQKDTTASASCTRQLACCDLSENGIPLSMLLFNMGIRPLVHGADALGKVQETWLVNCIGSTTNRLAGRVRASSQHLIVADKMCEPLYKDYGRTIVFPASFSQLRAVCWDTAQPTENVEEVRKTSFKQRI